MDAGTGRDDTEDDAGRAIDQVAELVSHDIGAAYWPVQGSLIDHHEQLWRIIPVKDRLPGQPSRYRLIDVPVEANSAVRRARA